MKKITTFLVASFITLNALSQGLSTLSQNFDVVCATFTGYPPGWSIFNPIPGTYPLGAWNCAPENGRDNTPGMDVTNFFNGINNLDTAYLMTPMLNVSTYVGHKIFFQFDTKTTNLLAGGRLAVLQSYGAEPFFSLGTYTDLSSTISPVIGNPDSTGWATHQVDLTGYETAGNFYLAFRFTGTDTTGSVWFVDNVEITTVPLGINTPANNEHLPITVVGGSTSSDITISCHAQVAGAYSLTLTDLMGNVVYKDNVNLGTGISQYTLNNRNFAPGMYFIKMSNGLSYGVTRVMVK